MTPKEKATARVRPPGVSEAASWDHAGGHWIEDEFWFDEAGADKAAEFFPKFLRFSKGKWAGKPFQLEPWEANDIIRPVFGWKRKDSTRRYRRCFVWVPRKNGKTELAAGIALLLLTGDGELGGEIYAIASHADQARIVFNQATMMVQHGAALSSVLNTFKNAIYCASLGGTFQALSGKAEGKHGLSCSGLIGDEIHEWKNGDLYQFIHDSEDAREQPLEFLISTAGKKGTYGEEVWDECIKIRDGLIPGADETLVVIYAAGEDDDPFAEETWFKANPNLGVSKNLDAMRSNARRARHLPRLENQFKNYQLNIWTEQAVRWLPINALDDNDTAYGWDCCVGDIAWQALDATLIGKLCYGGLDLSSTQDLSALVWWFPVQDGLETPVMISRFWKPAALIEAHSVRDKLPYEKWLKMGALKTTPGNVIDYAYIRKQIYSDAEKYQIAHVGNHDRKPHEGGLAIDRWNATETAVHLNENGIPVVFFGQGYASLSAPAKELERLVMSNAFHHGGHPIMRRHAQVVAVEEDAAGNIKPSKDKSSERIDGIAATCNALGISARVERSAPISPWENEDFKLAV